MKSKKPANNRAEILDENYDFELGKMPPSAVELESKILGAVLIDNQALNEIIPLIKNIHFYKSANGIIYQAMLNLNGKNEPIDAQTLKEELAKMGKLSEVGGVEYIIDLTTSTSTSANVVPYSRIVFEKYILRNLIHVSSKIVEGCLDPTVNAFEILSKAGTNILEISEFLSKKKVVALKDEIFAIVENLGNQRGKKVTTTGIPTGYYDLDEKTSGFQNSELIIIAGRPSHGKTSLTVNIARNAAVNAGKSVGFFSLEMTTREIILRLLAGEAKVDAKKLKTGKSSESEWNNVMRSFHSLKTNIYIDDSSELSIHELRAKAHRMKIDFNIDMIMVDYLQLIKGQANPERRDLEVAFVSRGLKALAKELNIPVVACAQLNRSIEKMKDRGPQLADLRESGAIEQDADVVIFVHRPHVADPKLSTDDPQYDEKIRKAEITIGKQRNGPTGAFELVYISEYTRFENKVKSPDIKIPSPGN